MGRKVVGITCGTQESSEGGGPRQVLNNAYVRAVERAGGLAVILPTTHEPDVIAGYVGILDGLLLSGGVDIDPACYGQSPHSQLGDVDGDRDATELRLIRAALAQDMPIFAICRGIQSLNVAMGGTLYQDLPSECPSDIHHYQTKRGHRRDEMTHLVTFAPESRIRQIAGDETMATNSMHHQALLQVAEGLVVTGKAADGVIESVEAPAHRYVLGVQFHPEETVVHDEKSRRLFEAFLRAL